MHVGACQLLNYDCTASRRCAATTTSLPAMLLRDYTHLSTALGSMRAEMCV